MMDIARRRIPRTRGMISGLALVILGAWGAIIPFVGPYFDFGYLPNQTWFYTLARLCLSIIPGAAAFVAGLILLGTASRSAAIMASWLACLAGAWFAVGPILSQLRHIPDVETPANNAAWLRVLEQIGFYYGVGVVILFFGAIALGRSTVVGVRESEYAARVAAAEEAAPATGAEAAAGTAGTGVAAPGTARTSYDDGAVDAPTERRRARRTWPHRRHATEAEAEETQEDLHRTT